MKDNYKKKCVPWGGHIFQSINKTFKSGNSHKLALAKKGIAVIAFA
jgi:hypothetical protein